MSINYASLLGTSDIIASDVIIENLTLSNNTFNAAGFTYKLPDINDILVTQSKIQPLSNKTIDSSAIGSLNPSSGSFSSLNIVNNTFTANNQVYQLPGPSIENIEPIITANMEQVIYNKSIESSVIGASYPASGRFTNVNTTTLTIPDNTIAGSKIVSLNGSKIIDNTISNAKLMTGIDGAKISDNTIINSKITSLDASKLTNLLTFTTSGHYISGLKVDDLTLNTTISLPINSLNGSCLKDNTISNAKLMTGIDGAKISDNTISNAKLMTGINGAKISDNTISNAKLMTGIEGGKITVNTITNDKIVSIDAGKITGYYGEIKLGFEADASKLYSIKYNTTDINYNVGIDTYAGVSRSHVFGASNPISGDSNPWFKISSRLVESLKNFSVTGDLSVSGSLGRFQCTAITNGEKSNITTGDLGLYSQTTGWIRIAGSSNINIYNNADVSNGYTGGNSVATASFQTGQINLNKNTNVTGTLNASDINSQYLWVGNKPTNGGIGIVFNSDTNLQWMRIANNNDIRFYNDASSTNKSGNIVSFIISSINVTSNKPLIVNGNLSATGTLSFPNNSITNAFINSVDATKITGSISNTQITSLDASKLTGTINAAILPYAMNQGVTTMSDVTFSSVTSSKSTINKNILNYEFWSPTISNTLYECGNNTSFLMIDDAANLSITINMPNLGLAPDDGHVIYIVNGNAGTTTINPMYLHVGSGDKTTISKGTYMFVYTIGTKLQLGVRTVPRWVLISKLIGSWLG